MHTIYWRLKRTYLLNLYRVQRHVTKRFGLTPARFDLMYCLLKNGGVSYQSRLWRALGVCSVTVMRMVHSLEELGFVTLRPSTLDRRQIEVAVTEEGLRRALGIIRDVMESGLADALVNRTFVSHAPEDEDACFRLLTNLDERFLSVQNALMDESTMGYPWHPDD